MSNSGGIWVKIGDNVDLRTHFQQKGNFLEMRSFSEQVQQVVEFSSEILARKALFKIWEAARQGVRGIEISEGAVVLICPDGQQAQP